MRANEGENVKMKKPKKIECRTVGQCFFVHKKIYWVTNKIKNKIFNSPSIPRLLSRYHSIKWSKRIGKRIEWLMEKYSSRIKWTEWILMMRSFNFRLYIVRITNRATYRINFWNDLEEKKIAYFTSESSNSEKVKRPPTISLFVNFWNRDSFIQT